MRFEMPIICSVLPGGPHGRLPWPAVPEAQHTPRPIRQAALHGLTLGPAVDPGGPVVGQLVDAVADGSPFGAPKAAGVCTW